jgi:hypothetical protein
MTDNNKPLPPAGRSGYPVPLPKSGESAPAGHFSLREIARPPVPEAVLSCGAPDVALWLYARGFDHYTVKTALRAYGFGDARYFADIMRDGPEGARQHAELEAVRAGNAIAPDVPYADDRPLGTPPGAKRRAPSCGRSCGTGGRATVSPPKPFDACCRAATLGANGPARKPPGRCSVTPASRETPRRWPTPHTSMPWTVPA